MLAETLARVAGAMVAAERPWWVIGSAAVVLHGGATEVRDVDVVVDPRDVDRIVAVTGAGPGEAGGDALFRSERFLRWDAPPLPVEFMAGFAVAVGGEWRAVEPRTRERVEVDGAALFVPDSDELRAMLATFGRPKDLARIAVLPA